VEPSDGQRASLLGPEFSDREIEVVLRDAGAAYRRIDDDAALCRHVAREIARGRVVGWFQGRMEYGPRALGSRSILGDARDPGMQSLVNRKVKFREGFRPFAPVVLAEHAHEFFEVAPGQESPYMLLVAPVRETKRVPVPAERAGATGFDKLALDRSVIPAVTHVDWSARIQTVDRGRHGLLRTLLEEFHRETGCPVLVNTSFNLSWEPIVCTPRDAYRTFMASGIDVLCMGHFVLDKAAPAAVALAAGDGAGAPRDEVLGEKLRSPCCAAELDPDAGGLRCRRCDHRFEVAGEIPRLFWPHEAIDGAGDVTEIVKAFYEEHPFPNYDDHDSVRSLIERSRRGRYARRLDESIPYDTDVLEIGCGTGQLANFLGIGGRRVIGTDMCLNSLALGEAFRRRHGLDRVRFVQMNLFRPAFRPEAFDVLLCNGVLHHTADAHGGFRTLLPLLRPGGHVVVGLYNRFGRLLSGLRRRIFGLTGGRGRWLDPILRDPALGRDKRAAWFADQYRHPHESTHTIAEVLAWFDRSGLEFVRGIPALRSEDDGLAGESLFEPQPRGSRLDHLAVELGQVLGSGQREGGFFLMIGRKPARRPGAERRVTAAAVEAAPAV
jgi:SAM-dependent methyltransferase